MSFKDDNEFFLDGHLVVRPGFGCSHPDPEYWLKLKRQALLMANHCATCSYKGGEYDLHHRHYDNFGREKLDDVVILCRRCHKAVGASIEERRRIEHEPPKAKPEIAEVRQRPVTRAPIPVSAVAEPTQSRVKPLRTRQ